MLLWGILKIVLIVLLILFLLLLAFLILVLFLPVGYTIEMRKEPDPPEPGSKAGNGLGQAGGQEDLAGDVPPPSEEKAERVPAYYVRVRAGWLFNAVCFKGAFEEKAGLSYQAKALWKTLRERKGTQ